MPLETIKNEITNIKSFSFVYAVISSGFTTAEWTAWVSSYIHKERTCFRYVSMPFAKINYVDMFKKVKTLPLFSKNCIVSKYIRILKKIHIDC